MKNTPGFEMSNRALDRGAQLVYLVRYSKPPYWGPSRAQLNIAGNFATRRMR